MDQLQLQQGTLFSMTPEMFGPLWPFVEDDEVTDIDFNGSALWITDCHNQKYKVAHHGITHQFIQRFAHRISDNDTRELNQNHPVLENETDRLRISILDESVATSGMSVCIRKTAPFTRINEWEAVQDRYCSQEIMSLLVNCVKAHMNIVVCGQPRAGKTEACKFLSRYIPDEERVITIEDTMEWRYKKLKPESDCIEMKVGEKFTYADGIIASLKQNPRWLMIAETRGSEVRNLIQGFSTGVHGMTTLHTDDVSKIPQRMVNMVDDSSMEQRFENNVYEFVDVGILVSVHMDRDGNRYRRIEQVGFFSNDNDTRRCIYLVKNGALCKKELASSTKRKFMDAGICDIYHNDAVNRRIEEGRREQGVWKA